MNIAPIDITLLAKLLIAHLLTDFVFQPNSWVKAKREKGTKTWRLYVHAIIAGVTTYVLLADWLNWWVPVTITVVHFFIDWGKVALERRKKPLKEEETDSQHNGYFVLDQLAHILVLVFIWLILIGDRSVLWSDIKGIFNKETVWVLMLGYIAVTYPVAKLISICTTPWSKILAKNKDEGLGNAGMYIGIFERILVLTFVLSGQYEAIGFLIAAKSILRFRSKDQNEPQTQTEYVLIGTLISLVIAIFIGLIIKYLISLC